MFRKGGIHRAQVVDDNHNSGHSRFVSDLKDKFGYTQQQAAWASSSRDSPAELNKTERVCRIIKNNESRPACRVWYNSTMSPTEVLERLFEPVGDCLTPEVAGRLVNLRAGDEIQNRLDELAVKSSAGSLTPAEHAEYESYVRGMNFIAVLQAKARRLLAGQSSAE